MFLLNCLVILFCVWVVIFMNNKVFQSALVDRHRFKLFALRDRLALAAMRGDIDQNSVGYGALCSIINATIRQAKAVEPIAITQFVLQIKNDQLEYNFDTITSMAEGITCDEFDDILGEYFSITWKLFMFNTLFLRLTIVPIGVVAHFSDKAANCVNNVRNAEGYVEKFAHAHS